MTEHPGEGAFMDKLIEFHDAHMTALQETRELLISALAKIDELNHNRIADLARMMAVEAGCEAKRLKYLELKPLVPAVFGTGPHDPGLMARVNKLERSVITKRTVMALTGVTAAIIGAASGLLAGLGGIWHNWLDR